MFWIALPVALLLVAATATLAGMQRSQVAPPVAADHTAAAARHGGPDYVSPEQRERAICAAACACAADCSARDAPWLGSSVTC